MRRAAQIPQRLSGPQPGNAARHVELKIPKLRQGSYFPAFLEPRKTAEKALTAVIQEAYDPGRLDPQVDDLVQALGMTGISKSQVSVCARISTSACSLSWSGRSRASGRILARRDLHEGARGRPHRVGGGNNRCRRQRRRPARDRSDWRWVRRKPSLSGSSFCAGLVRRGLKGVKLVISDAHEGLKAAIAKVLSATWQRCRVHFMRNALAHAGKQRPVVVGRHRHRLRPGRRRRRRTWRRRRSAPPALPEARRPDGRGRARRARLHDLPDAHRAKLHSTNPIERLNGEIKRRTEVVGIFPNEEAIIRLVGAILLEQNDEWAVQRARYMTLETIAPLSDDPFVTLPAVAGMTTRPQPETRSDPARCTANQGQDRGAGKPS